MNKILLGGIEVMAILLAISTTIYVKDSGTKTSCRNGFEEIFDGEYKGYYSCTTNSGIRYETCFEVYDSANTKNYWCKKGARVEIKSQPMDLNLPQKGDYVCNKRPNPCEKIR